MCVITPTIHLIHGFVGSGKTTFAKKLERDIGAFRITQDEWMVKLYGVAPQKSKLIEYYANVNYLIRQTSKRLIELRIDVILDSGFWTRSSRDEARKWIKDLKANCKLYSVRCSDDIMQSRVLTRTANLQEGTFWINQAAIDEFRNRFELLGPDEEHLEIETD